MIDSELMKVYLHRVLAGSGHVLSKQHTGFCKGLDDLFKLELLLDLQF